METLGQDTAASGRTPPVRAHEPSSEDEISLLAVLNIFLRHWRSVAGLPLAAMLVTAIAAVVVPPTFTATSTFVPEETGQRRIPSALSGLAGQFGITFGTEPTQSPRFYADVLKSRELMERVLLTRFAGYSERNDLRDSVTLLRTLRVHGRDLADSLFKGVRALTKSVQARVNTQTNIVTMTVDAHDPQLAADVANCFIKYLNDFNARTRQSQARERRKFVEQRVAEGERDLRRTEEDLKTFYEQNRSWQQSPQLTFREGELRRRVQIQQELYLTLKREFETARIEEVNDTPVITVIDRAVPPREKSKPKLVILLPLALVLGAMISGAWALAADQFDRARQGGGKPYLEFTKLLSPVRRRVRALLRRGALSED
jgi:uncharacterized protein involved in exopolysaccharide biosynthesis